jgi:hypothetical protein
VPFLIFGLLLCVALALGAGIALSIALRYRAGTARRKGRRWVATANVWSTAFGAGFFLLTAACMSFWIRQAFPYALIGMLSGAVLGALALALTRWEAEGETFHYTPNRWLALVVVFALAGRLAYGWWRGVHVVGAHSWTPATLLSLAIAAGVIGYYLIYAIGLRRRLIEHHRAR